MEEEKKIENRRKGSKKYMIIIFLLALIVGGSCGLYYVDTFYGQGKINTILSSLQEKKKEQTVAAEEGTDKNSVSLSSGGTLFATKGKRFLMCTKDGVKYMNDMGDQRWNDTFTMSLPELAEEGNYWAVGDLSGKTVKVYNESGPLYTVQTTGNVLYFALNRNGYLGVITKEKEVYSVGIYSNDGSQLAGRQEGESGVYPFSIDISDDNRVFSISYLDTTDIEPLGRVNFFFVNESEGRNFSESMFASFEKKDELIPKIFYLDNGNLAVVSDKALYGIGSDGVEKWSIELTNHISYIGLEKKKYIVVAYGSAISGRNSRKVGNVSWINGDGKEIADFQAKDTVTALHCNNTGTVIGCGKTYYGLKIGGRAFWEYTATKDMTDVLLMENVNNVLFVTKDNAVILNIDKISQDTTVNEEKEKVKNTEKIIKKQQNTEEGEEGEQEEENQDEKQQQNTENDNSKQNENDKNNEQQQENKNNQTQQNNEKNEDQKGQENQNESENQQDNEEEKNNEGQQNNGNQDNQGQKDNKNQKNNIGQKNTNNNTEE